MPARKRTHDEFERDEAPPPPSLLTRIRNDWRFANILQYIQIFGAAVKIDEDIDVDVMEEELLKQPHSDRLTEIGLAMLKMISSHRGLTPEIFDEYTRRQYTAKAPHRNPFGIEEQPAKFSEMDVFTKLSVLHQLSVWTFFNPDRMRERMPDKDSRQMEWRIPPAGWDSDDREYYVLDDSRLYRLTQKPLPAPPKPKKRKAKAPPKKAARGSRSSKRQKLLNRDSSDVEEEEVDDSTTAEDSWTEPDDNGIGGNKWELVAITLEDYRAFMDTIKKSRDPNEKALYRYLEESSIPALERAAASRARKNAARERELAALEKMAHAKRSSRISSRQQAHKEAEEREAAEIKKREERIAAQKEMDRQNKMEEDRESRMMTREQRVKDREARRILHEEEIERLSSEQASETQDGRMSERNRKLHLKRKRDALEELKQEEQEDWYFDCAKCGTHGKNIDDGSHSMACEMCGTWQHSKCHGITEQQAESDDFHFVCASCSRPPKQIKLNVTPKAASSHTHTNGAAAKTTAAVQASGSKTSPKLRQSAAAQPGSAVTQRPPQAHFSPPQTAYYPQQHVAPSHPFGTNGHLPPQQPANGTARPHQVQSQVQASEQSQPGYQWQHPSIASTPQHNPYLNNFSRQRQVQTTPTQQPSPSFQSQSPAPSLSATQGTNIHFSPSASHSAVPGSHAYTPTSNRPSSAAYSPTKRMSSPIQPAAGPLSSPPQAKYPVPAMQNHVLPSAASGMSPVKHAQLSSSPPVSLAMPTPPIAGPHYAQHPPAAPPEDSRGVPLASAFPALPPAPSLSPSQAQPDLSVPVKRDPSGSVH